MRSLLPFSRFMQPTREGEADAFTRLKTEVDRLFDDFGRFDLTRWPAMHAFGGGFPKLNVSETDKTLEIDAELAGLDEKDVEVVLGERTLTIKGERKDEREERKKDYLLSERTYGAFSRTIPLPFEPDAGAVNAEFKKGVLHISIEKPKDVAAKTVKIPVKST